jgi:phage/plasmid-like protein (TIGR03299 family)
MSHNLNIVHGAASMMYVGETPWHTLGTKLDKPATASEAIQAAGLGFHVEKMPLQIAERNLPVRDHYATVRTDTMDVLGVVGSRYMPIQNKDAFTTFDSLVGEGSAIYHTAGALGKGERIWILAKLPDYIRIRKNDIVEQYLLFTNTHDGTCAVSVKLTPIRVVCENTLSVALQGTEQQVRIRHTTQAEEKLKQAHQILGLSNKLFETLGEYYVGMSWKTINAVMLNQYIDSVFPLPMFSLSESRMRETHEKIIELSEVGVGAELAKGTLWGAYNAVTEYVDHYRLQSKSDSVRLKSMWYGSGDALKKKAFTCAVAMLN